MINNAEDMAALVEAQMQTITDPIVYASLRLLLIPPIKQEREWFYGGTDLVFTCWLVWEDKQSNIGIAYSDFGFGPDNPWGLVFLPERFIGDDESWFPTLERTFYDTYPATDLKIWNVVKMANGKILEVIENDLTNEKAYEKLDQLKSDYPTYYYTVTYRTFSSA